MLKNNFKSSKEARTGKGEKLKLDSFPDSTGRPTGQGFGAARKGPSVVTLNRGGPAKQKYPLKLNRGGPAKQKYPLKLKGGGMPARMRNR